MRAEPEPGWTSTPWACWATLAGEVPFEDAADPQELFFLKFNRPVRPIRQVKPELPEGVERALTRMMAVDPQDRFPSVHHAMVALEAAIMRQA